MPVTGGNQSTVTVSVPVPTPVQQRPKSPVSFGPAQVQAPSVRPKGQPDDELPPHPAGNLSAVILPWNPQPSKGPTQLKRVGYEVVRYAAPIRAVNAGETAHAALTRFLGGRPQRRHGRTSLVHTLPNGDIAVRLHNTQVVTAHQNGQVTMNHGGYMTPTSRRFISGYSGVPVSFSGGKFTVRNPHTGVWEEYTNNTPYPPAPKEREVLPERGRLTPEQVELLRQHRLTGEVTPLGMLGDSLTESGYPHSGELISRLANNDPGSGGMEIGEYHPAYQQSPELREHEFHFVPGSGKHDAHDLHIEVPKSESSGTRGQFRVVGSKPAPTQMSRRRTVTPPLSLKKRGT